MSTDERIPLPPYDEATSLRDSIEQAFKDAAALPHSRQAQLVQSHLNQAYVALHETLEDRATPVRAHVPPPVVGPLNLTPWQLLNELPAYAEIGITIADDDGQIIDTKMYGRERHGIVRDLPADHTQRSRRVTLIDSGSELFATERNVVNVRVISYKRSD